MIYIQLTNDTNGYYFKYDNECNNILTYDESNDIVKNWTNYTYIYAVMTNTKAHILVSDQYRIKRETFLKKLLQ